MGVGVVVGVVVSVVVSSGVIAKQPGKTTRDSNKINEKKYITGLFIPFMIITYHKNVNVILITQQCNLNHMLIRPPLFEERGPSSLCDYEDLFKLSGYIRERF